MASASTIGRDRGSRGRGFVAALTAKPLATALGLLTLTVSIRAFGTVDSDVSWQLWIAHQLNGGVRLYRDIIETNPPLWFWMGMPVDWLARLIHLRSDHVLIAAIGGAAALSLCATDRLLPPIAGTRRTLLLAYAALALVALPWAQFGQREQLVLIGTLPYAALIAARRADRPVMVGLAILVGAGAALGFALKHYFLLVPILLELWLIVGRRRSWRPLRPETLAVGALGALYAIAFAIAGRDYFSVALPMILLAYGVTGAERLIDLFQPAVLTALATLALTLARPRAVTERNSDFATALLIAATGFAGAYFIQAKGWSYHAVPLAGCAAISLAAVLAQSSASRPIALAAPALLALPFWIAAQQALHISQTEQDVSEAVDGLNAGAVVGFVGSDPSLGWNVTLQRGFGYPSRYNGFWMMRAIVRDEASGSRNSRLAELGRRVVRETVRDFRCLPPRRIVIARPTAEAARAGEFDILPFFLRDPEFARLLSHYRPVQRTTVETFDRISPLERGSNCLRRAGD
jgi:hypothetical protein